MEEYSGRLEMSKGKYGWKLYVYYNALSNELFTSIMEPEHLTSIMKFFKVKKQRYFYVGEL